MNTLPCLDLSSPHPGPTGPAHPRAGFRRLPKPGLSATFLSAHFLALMAVFSPETQAADSEMKRLRAEMQKMRESYEQRLLALEQRLVQTESSAQTAKRSAAEASKAASDASVTAASAQTLAETSSQNLQQTLARPNLPASESAFNPAVSLILSGMYTNLKDNPEKRSYQIGGFIPSNGEVAPPARGFSLGESELAVSANIDHRFRGRFVLALPPEDGATPSVEEAFIQTLGLSGGFNLKAGRFLSGVGYMNEQHAHAWDFSDAPLAYKAFLGGQLKGEGVQLKWLAPTEQFLEFGVEGGKGGSFPSTDRAKNGFTTGSAFVHTGGDIGLENSWKAGLSVISSQPRNRQYDDTDVNGVATTNTFNGSSRTWIADGVWKWAPNGDSSQRYLQVQGEYFVRNEKGRLSCADKDSASPSNCAGGVEDGYRSRQSGGYWQAVYRFAPEWRIGYRYDRLNAGDVSLGSALNPADLPILASYKPTRNTVMMDWSPSEFSRVRFQIARDKSRPDGDADQQIWLHYIVSLGAHGAHKY